MNILVEILVLIFRFAGAVNFQLSIKKQQFYANRFYSFDEFRGKITNCAITKLFLTRAFR